MKIGLRLRNAQHLQNALRRKRTNRGPRPKAVRRLNHTRDHRQAANRMGAGVVASRTAGTKKGTKPE